MNDEDDQPTCDYCGTELDPADETPNLRLTELHESQGWVRTFCCPGHLITWINEDPPQLDPHLATGG